MTNATLDKLIWVLIYGGLLTLGLGLFVMRGDAGFGWALVLLGAAVAVLGAVLIVVRSRRGPDH
jgi:hypothetical protein